MISRRGFLSRFLAGMGLSFLLPPGKQLRAGGSRNRNTVSSMNGDTELVYDGHAWHKIESPGPGGVYILDSPQRALAAPPSFESCAEFLLLGKHPILGRLRVLVGMRLNIPATSWEPLYYRWLV